MTMTSTIWHDGEGLYSGHINNVQFTKDTLETVKEMMDQALDDYALNG